MRHCLFPLHIQSEIRPQSYHDYTQEICDPLVKYFTIYPPRHLEVIWQLSVGQEMIFAFLDDLPIGIRRMCDSI